MFYDYICGIKDSVLAYLTAIDKGLKEEDARMFLPNAAATNIVMSMNARALFEMATKRTCALAQWEFDIVATSLVVEAYNHAPSIFETAGPECCRTKCREGKRSCGIPLKTPLASFFGNEEYPHDMLIFGMK
jgi:thymidylate synthase (FAD)